MTGNHEKNRAGTPQFLTRVIAVSLLRTASHRDPTPFAPNSPSIQVVKAPRVLPTVAVTTNNPGEMLPWETSQPRTASEPPGAMVDEMKALTNKPHRAGATSVPISDNEENTEYVSRARKLHSDGRFEIPPTNLKAFN